MPNKKEIVVSAKNTQNLGELGVLVKKARALGRWSATYCWLGAFEAACIGSNFLINKEEFLERSPFPVKGKHGSL